jgi:hypothetical protein
MERLGWDDMKRSLWPLLTLVFACRPDDVSIVSTPLVVTVPNPPVLVSPPNGRGIGVPSIVTLRWKQVPNAGSYAVELAPDSFFRRMEFTAIVETLSVRTTPLSPNRYYWHVKAYLPSGTETAWSQTWWFLQSTLP